ncbi:MAG: hypothetical protein M1549_02360 [Candidatus Dependentiae bacterium]|nr:hypothetical protein [Candidatus Dependentiae bacterium]
MRIVNYLVLAGLLVAQLPASISAQPAPIGGAPQICAVAPLPAFAPRRVLLVAVTVGPPAPPSISTPPQVRWAAALRLLR